MTAEQFVFGSLVRWVSFLALAALIGGIALDLVILPRDSLDMAGGRARLRRATRAWILLLALTAAAELWLRTQTMARGGVATTLAAVPAVLTRTSFGTAWIVRLVALALVLLASLLRARAATIITVVAAATVAFTTSLTGHAGDWGTLAPSVFIDWTHLLASGAWAGGVIVLGFIVFRARRPWPSSAVAPVVTRFSRMAGLCLLAVTLSGAYNAWVQIPTISALWTTGYGRFLCIKLALVLVVVWLGAINRYAVVPRLLPRPHVRQLGVRLFRVARLVLRGPRSATARDPGARLVAMVTGEAVVVTLVLAATAALTDSVPARHAVRMHHPTAGDDEQAAVHVTMDELHAAGGVPKGWRFRPPEGDPERGRRVFARLECFACHRVQGEPFPAASRPGPDLTGMGAHHPAGYLAESVINPNAVIVDGPGYTGLDGRSIMPDYRDSLSLSELVDLVAYLKSLDSG